MTAPVFVIPDIHGHKAKLDLALSRIAAQGGLDAPVVFLGDYVDRGPDSRGVIETLIRGIEAGRHWVVLRGNHDQLFLDFLETGALRCNRLRAGLTWLHPRMGGAETLASYGVTASEDRPNLGSARAAVPRAHRDFLASLPYWHRYGDLLLVHAGIRPGVPLDRQCTDDLLWIRDEFLIDPCDHGPLIVHGHTPVDWPEHRGNRVALDGGAGWGRDLHVAMISGRKVSLLRAEGAEVLEPMADQGST